jgi:hypothetical protein
MACLWANYKMPHELALAEKKIERTQPRPDSARSILSSSKMTGK